ncbi:hypothetical protein [Bacteroides fragilis]|jgi:hypothetical protein|uniref:hypothetical protein n=1 Tax=Bacteroides fragilis TaxID=817 RepID=UPI00202EDE53|nr:hypothetical protein [Bacteroides fragilis]DAO85618.1 MAG TPA: hypothetical protein [Caudoviricetes sp.]MCM0193965.1 hypothetical protein [Bacteroides fragilis]MCM0201314.1 hypothetical protein [Bacteroides fragilis]MCM0211884.1 hypothetical protein [Bacteroides fragilis]MCM0216529.1 hypothetical protein [Bacteroides fragilis]
MTLITRFNQLQNDVIAKLSAITDRPDGWLPHLVFVEEESEDQNNHGAPVYNAYRLVDFKPDGSCTLQNTITNEDDTERYLSEINIDWLMTVLNWYGELATDKDIDQPLPRPSCAGFKQGDLVCLNEEAIQQIRRGFGDAPAEYRKTMLLEVCGSELDSGIVRVKDIREDDIQEFSAECLRLFLSKDERCFLTTSAMSHPDKELSVFLYPLERMDRDATDEDIIADWKSDEEHDIPTRKLTPDEFAEECNDEMFADQVYWVRFIYYQS